MKKTLITIGLYMSLLGGATAQKIQYSDNENYQKRKLKIDEINLVSSYYEQDGNTSAVTGGVGTEQLMDIANSIDLKLSKFDKKDRQHSLLLDFNIDYYTSASSDNIDPSTFSSASKEDLHIYPSLSYNLSNEAKGTNKGLSLSYSTEWDYESYGLNISYSKLSKDKNREISLKGGAFFDKWEVIQPIELRVALDSRYRPRNSYNLAFSVSQIINQRLQVMGVIEPAYQEGLLSTPYHRIYTTANKVTTERLPGSRFKLPTGVRVSYFLGDKYVFRTFYRFYFDNWGMTAHTINIEPSIKVTPFFSVSPYYRFHAQKAVAYFKPYAQHSPTATYRTSDYDIGDFNSNFFGAGFRFVPKNGAFGFQYFNSLEIRYGHYTRTTGMVSNIITLATKFK